MSDFINDIRKKDKNAVTVLYNRFGRKLFGYAVNKWQTGEDETWDLVYTTLYKVIEVADKYTFENENKFTAFVFTIFTNNLRNLYQKKKNQNIEITSLKEEDAVSQKAEDVMDDKPPESEQMKHLQEELQQLEDWKRVLLLMRAQDFSYEEIAKYVDKPPDQLKVYHMRIKKELTEKINKRINNKNA